MIRREAGLQDFRKFLHKVMGIECMLGVTERSKSDYEHVTTRVCNLREIASAEPHQ